VTSEELTGLLHTTHSIAADHASICMAADHASVCMAAHHKPPGAGIIFYRPDCWCSNPACLTRHTKSQEHSCTALDAAANRAATPNRCSRCNPGQPSRMFACSAVNNLPSRCCSRTHVKRCACMVCCAGRQSANHTMHLCRMRIPGNQTAHTPCRKPTTPSYSAHHLTTTM
jgi:hypothetical protein